ncbi:MAG: MFS transporter [Pseudomonas sp.]|uniref:MFS transporter n=1 Tax=Pseudomonas sp. TaxID=306 RepID=UPI003D10858D
MHEPTDGSPASMPAAVYWLALTIFVLTTSEFMVAGMMPSLAAVFDVSTAQIGYLIALYALGMVLGGPLLTALFLWLKVPSRQALLWQLALYLIGGVLAAGAGDYGTMAVARVITGVAGSACIGGALAICGERVVEQVRGRATSVVLSGMMLATVLGVPAATLVDAHLGWRASFWIVVALTALCLVIVAMLVPSSPQPSSVGLGQQFRALGSGKLWAAYASSGLVIAAAYAAFTYITAILTEVSGVPGSLLPILLGLYGVMNLVGNTLVGRFADRFTFAVLGAGLSVLGLTLLVFALCAEQALFSVVAFLVIGLVGVPMSPALIVRVMRTANPGPLVNSVHVSVINAGLAFIAWAGGLAIQAGHGLKAPLWIGALMALLALLTLLPAQVRASLAPRAA